MSTVISISTRRRYGVARVCRAWGVARAGVYRRRGTAEAPPAPRRRPGPQGLMSDAALVEAIRQVTGTAGPTQVPGARRAMVSGFGMINYDRGLCSGAAILKGNGP